MKTQKKSSTAVYVYGIVMIFIQALSNIANAPWTIWLTAEQIDTGWKGGTGIEMLALLPFTSYVFTIPVIIGVLLYFTLHVFKGSDRTIFITNIVLLLLLVSQIAITILFMFY